MFEQLPCILWLKLAENGMALCCRDWVHASALCAHEKTQLKTSSNMAWALQSVT